MVTVIIIDVVIALIVSYLWVRAIDKEIENEQFQYTEDELNEFKEWDATLEDGLDDETPLSEIETTTDEPVVEEPFVDTTMPKAQFQGSHRVTLTMNGTETAPIIFTPEMLREIKQREDTMWGRDNDESR